MPPSLSDLARYLSCPDDGAAVVPSAAGLKCPRCARSFPAPRQNVLELLPSRPFPLPFEAVPAAYREGYLREFSHPLEFRDSSRAWGAPEGMLPKWVQSRQRQARAVLDFLRCEKIERGAVFCDLSAGAGYCTFEASREYRMVFHCELSADSLAYAAAKAKSSQLENIIFVRADYFQPPFRNNMDRLVCLDTLIRGQWHETAVLASIRRVLAVRGAAVVDFHNWWHNPVRRMGLLRNNFTGNRSYTQSELRKLLANSGIRRFHAQGFVQEFDPSHILGRFICPLVPPTRWMVRLQAGSSFLLEQAEVRGWESYA